MILHHRGDPKKEIETYALLDDASDPTVVTNRVKNQLGIDTCLNLSTMHGREIIPVTPIDGLIVGRPDRHGGGTP